MLDVALADERMGEAPATLGAPRVEDTVDHVCG
jgi:hypothetical protein